MSAPFRFLHAADLHLDSPLRGLARRGSMADSFLDASRRALENLVAAAIAHEAAFLIIAGDIYDGDWKDFATGQFFVRQMGRLAQADIRVFILRGNHDAASLISRELPLPSNVHEFSVHRAESVTMEELGVTLHGRGFAERHVPENIVLDYPPARAGHFNIGVLHTSLTGREGHEVYAPCTVPDLLRLGYDYWALGHVHQREVVHDAPPIVFPGNLQGRHARETGPKGATLVDVEDGRITALTPLILDTARFETLELDLSGAQGMAHLHHTARAALRAAAEIAEGRPVAARIVLRGVTSLHPHLLAHPAQIYEDMQALASEAGPDMLVEKVVTATQDVRTHGELALTGFDAILDEVASDPAFLAEIAATLGELRAKAPQDLTQLDESASLSDSARATAAIEAARQGILARLADDVPLAEATTPENEA